MAQTGYTPISIYYSSTASAVPTAGNLVAGELAINTADGRLFYKDSAGVVQVIAGKGGSGVAGGSTTQVQYNSSGSLAGSANMTFSGTALTLANDASISGLTVGKGASAVSTNSVLGYQAGQAVTSGGQLVAIGYQSAYSNTTGGDNVAIGGYQALYSNTSGSQNIAIGRSALTANTTGGSNVGIGYQTLYSNTTASNNTAVGYQAGYSTTTGSNNVIMGNTAGYTNSTGQYNTYIGDRAGYSANYAGASVNTFIGNYSGYSVTSGIANTFVGSGPSFSAGSAITTGSKNTIIGAYSGNNGGLDIRTASNYIVLSDGDGNPRVVVNDSGALGLNGANYGTSGQALISAGSAAVPAWGDVVTPTGTQTLTNKRITPRVSTTTSSATPTINTDNTDQYGLTAQAVDITSFTTNLSGTPTDGQKLWIYIVGTAARAITWGASFESSTATLPSTTVSTNRLDIGFVWNTATTKWRCVAVA